MQDLPNRPFLESALKDLERKIKQGKAKRIPLEIKYSNGKTKNGFGIEYTNMFIIVSKVEVKDILRKVAHLYLGRQYLNSAKAIRCAKFELCQRFNVKYKTNFYPAKIVIGELEELPERADFYVKLISENLRSQGKAPFYYDSEEVENAIENISKLVDTGHLFGSFRFDRGTFDTGRHGSYGQAVTISDWARRKLDFNDSQVRAEAPIKGERPGQRENLYQRVHINLSSILDEELRDELDFYHNDVIPSKVWRNIQITIAIGMSQRLPFDFRPEDFLLEMSPYKRPAITAIKACIDRLIREENGRWNPTHEAPKSNGIGDTSCVNNARSKYLRCAVNPMSNCEECEHYESSPKMEVRFPKQSPVNINLVPTKTTAPRVEHVSDWEPVQPFISTEFRNRHTLKIHLTNQQRRDLTAMLLNEQGSCTISIDNSEMRLES